MSAVLTVLEGPQPVESLEMTYKKGSSRAPLFTPLSSAHISNSRIGSRPGRR